jgi:hypothetical protein
MTPQAWLELAAALVFGGTAGYVVIVVEAWRRRGGR